MRQRSIITILLVLGVLALAGGAFALAGAQSATASVKLALNAARSSNGLAYSTASASVVQSQPAAGSCHASGQGLDVLPDPRCTPGALNPAVTQATIRQTICKRGWTSTVRPSESVTEAEKRASMAAYGDHAPMGDYEYDHLVSLELGGAVNDARNLWPEPGASPNPKDAVENELNAMVCDGKVSLAQAQHEIATDWLTVHGTRPGSEGGAAPGGGSSSGSGSGSSGSSGGSTAPSCTVSASYSSRYGDWDVYVHSNQPDASVTVTDAGGQSASYHADSSGYADVYLKAPASAVGEQLTAHAGQATCTATM